MIVYGQLSCREYTKYDVSLLRSTGPYGYIRLVECSPDCEGECRMEPVYPPAEQPTQPDPTNNTIIANVPMLSMGFTDDELIQLANNNIFLALMAMSRKDPQ
jgi:hypothetical protein